MNRAPPVCDADPRLEVFLLRQEVRDYIRHLAWLALAHFLGRAHETRAALSPRVAAKA